MDLNKCVSESCRDSLVRLVDCFKSHQNACTESYFITRVVVVVPRRSVVSDF